MIEFQENTRTEKNGRADGRTDRPYFIEPFQLPPEVQKYIWITKKVMKTGTIEEISNLN